MSKLIIIVTMLSMKLFSTEPIQNKYQLLSMTLNNKSFIIARCNTETGEAWYRLGSKWFKAVEANPIQKSIYTCKSQNLDDNNWIFLRMDEVNGRIWTLQGEVWRITLDAEPPSVVEPAKN